MQFLERTQMIKLSTYIDTQCMQNIFIDTKCIPRTSPYSTRNFKENQAYCYRQLRNEFIELLIADD